MKRDLNPHKPAVMAMCLFASDYAGQSLGSMGYWDSLREGDKQACRDAVEQILKAPDEFTPRRRRSSR